VTIGRRIALLLEDICRPLVAREEILAFRSLDEPLLSADAGEQAINFSLFLREEHGLYQIVSNSRGSLLNLQALNEEIKEVEDGFTFTGDTNEDLL
jgi:hypothetical protein